LFLGLARMAVLANAEGVRVIGQGFPSENATR
jgi:hypothetical protein